MVRISSAPVVANFEDLPDLVKIRISHILKSPRSGIRSIIPPIGAMGQVEEEPPALGAWLFCRNVKPITQSGPTCGLVALQMAMQQIGASLISVDDILDKAREQGYTKNGEMFSTTYLALLVNDLWEAAVLSCVAAFPSPHELIGHLHENSAVLVPYDCDRHCEPAMRGGHSAHWASIVGYLLIDPSIDEIRVPNKEDVEKLPITIPNLYLLISQGKSKFFGLHSFKLIESSNAQLYEAGPQRNDDEYVIPDAKNLSELRNRVVLVRREE